MSQQEKRIKLFRFLLLNTLSFLLNFSVAESSTFTLKEVRNYCLLKQVDYRIVETIADIESVKRKGYQLGYPFVIRVNDSKVRIRGLKKLRRYGNVYDCVNEKLCQYVARKLISKGIKNFDMGVFQINYLYNRHRKDIIKRAFNTKEAYKIACDIVSENIKKYGLSLWSIALYHSETPYLNRLYARKFIKIYRRKKTERVNYEVYDKYLDIKDER